MSLILFSFSCNFVFTSLFHGYFKDWVLRHGVLNFLVNKLKINERPACFVFSLFSLCFFFFYILNIVIVAAFVVFIYLFNIICLLTILYDPYDILLLLLLLLLLCNCRWNINYHCNISL